MVKWHALASQARLSLSLIPKHLLSVALSIVLRRCLDIQLSIDRSFFYHLLNLLCPSARRVVIMLYSTITVGLAALAAAQKQQTLLDDTTNFDAPQAVKANDNTIILYTEEYWEFKTAADNVNAQAITPSPALVSASPTDVAVLAFDGQGISFISFFPF